MTESIEDQIERAVNARFEKVKGYLRSFPFPSENMQPTEYYRSFFAYSIADGLEWEG